MIAYERKGNVPSVTPEASSSSSPPFRNSNENNFQPKAIISRSWCNFCEEPPAATVQVTKTPDSQGNPPLFPLPNTTFSINWIISRHDATLLDMVVIPEQQNHLKNFMEGKTSTIANLSEEVNKRTQL
jgi:hypothetical protein